jgi:hypothetical protein
MGLYLLFPGSAISIWCVVCARFVAFAGAGANSNSCSSALCNNMPVIEILYAVIKLNFDWH